jgi:hypothetical protein
MHGEQDQPKNNIDVLALYFLYAWAPGFWNGGY